MTLSATKPKLRLQGSLSFTSLKCGGVMTLSATEPKFRQRHFKAHLASLDLGECEENANK